MVREKFWNAGVYDNYHFFYFGNFGLIYQNCLEFDGDVHFFRLGPDLVLLGKFGLKSQNFQLRLKFNTLTNFSLVNS